MKVSDVMGKCDYFWVFVPYWDAWRLARVTDSTALYITVCNSDMWIVVLPNLSQNWSAVAIEQPDHPHSVAISKDGPR